ncbi:hypothetical protein AK812_SmicGene46037 [Symbiodinium microadriaticum]|uniref:Uncharacterized protein n=1 Tax=Symbiodinium microadriaticum TaxID=2951 RepID=A0A1Q9BUU3_SYMMI|nr:hypothetical protein AK812_SmicGene46037 [Symbiodinium microadriaticum]
MHPFAWLGLATSVVLALRGVGCPCPAVQLLSFWRVASAELVDSLEAKTAYQRKFMRKVRKGFVMKNKLSVGKAGTYEKKRWKNSKVTAVVGRLPKLKITQRNIAAIGDLELNFRPGGTDLNILYFGSKKDIEGAEFEILP